MEPKTTYSFKPHFKRHHCQSIPGILAALPIQVGRCMMENYLLGEKPLWPIVAQSPQVCIWQVKNLVVTIVIGKLLWRYFKNRLQIIYIIWSQIKNKKTQMFSQRFKLNIYRRCQGSWKCKLVSDKLQILRVEFGWHHGYFATQGHHVSCLILHPDLSFLTSWNITRQHWPTL